MLFPRKSALAKCRVSSSLARLAQLVEHSTDTRAVLGSNPRARTREPRTGAFVVEWSITNAAVVKLVNTLASGASLRKGLGVRVSPAAQNKGAGCVSIRRLSFWSRRGRLERRRRYTRRAERVLVAEPGSRTLRILGAKRLKYLVIRDRVSPCPQQ